MFYMLVLSKAEKKYVPADYNLLQTSSTLQCCLVLNREIQSIKTTAKSLQPQLQTPQKRHHQATLPDHQRFSAKKRFRTVENKFYRIAWFY